MEALSGIDLEIARGEFVAVIGPNGSGKSTLAKHFNALLLPTEGRVLVAGRDTRDPDLLWEVRRSAGMVFQNPDNQLVATVVEEDVAFGPENLGVEPEQIVRRVESSLDAVGMLARREYAPHELSGGQKQRVAIAGILAMEPEILVLDEPTAMLDPLGRREVLETVMDLNRQKGITVVFITHFMDEAVRADRVIVMDKGRVVLQGPPREVFGQIDMLHSVGLDVPQIAEVARRLRDMGVDVPPGVLTVDELVAAVCR
ncbi:MAG: energy-coupling factor transporter ATPase [Bacillota bacterium]|nr:energy-coupling factor transporter ATPase [Bacillota bacterium]